MVLFLQFILLKHRSYIFGSITALISAIYTGLLTYYTLIPNVKLAFEAPFPHFDLVMHFFGYMFLSFFMLQTLYHLFRIARIKSFLTMLYIIALLGASSEVLQHYLTNGSRRVEFADFIADVLGALSVFVLLLLKSKEKNQFAKHPK